jgi:hypothetical protein
MAVLFPSLAAQFDAVAIVEFPVDPVHASIGDMLSLLVTPNFGSIAAIPCDAQDVDLLCDVQTLLIEDVDFGQTFGSGLWTVAEVIGYLNQRQDDFIKQTQIVQKRAPLFTVAETHRFDLPQDLAILRRVVFHSGEATPERTYTPVCRGDSWELDQALLDWEYTHDSHFPTVYGDTEAHTLGIEVGRGTTMKGVLEALYVPLGLPLSNSGVCFSIPEMFVPAVRWGVLASMLRKVGRSADPERAAYAEQRYDEGIEAAKMMLGGWA